MKTKKPSAIVYGYPRNGTEILYSDVYYEEFLEEQVTVHFLPYTDEVFNDYTQYQPDLIISFFGEINVPHYQLERIYLKYDEIFADNVLANIIVCQSVFRSCEMHRPRFSIFTPCYKTGERILRTYEGLRNQVWTNWEWIVVDDSPDEETWKILQQISNQDYRVKPQRVYPLSHGNIGLAKHRAAILGDGDWLVELDHDDYLTKECLATCNDAIEKFPDAGFLYTNCSEMYEDKTPKYYDHDWSGDWYGRIDNFFDFGYAGHTWVEVDGEEILAHHYPDINPLTIRFNISMPNHLRMWERNLYHKIGGHNKRIPVADDFELIVRTFLHTKMIHVKKVLYLQYNNKDSTVDNNAQDINRRARLVRDHHDLAIHNRIEELGGLDWNWDEKLGHSQKLQNRAPIRMFHENEYVLNYIYE